MDRVKASVVIVGAGPAGIGVAVALRDFGVREVMVVDRREVGGSMMRWPRETRLLTPSFNTTPFGILDLNAIALNTSVANLIGSEHPTGREYAAYLKAVALACELHVRSDVEVREVDRDGSGYFLETNRGLIEADFVVWATGEFGSPRLDGFPGAEHCLHTAQIRSFGGLSGEERVVIGGFESGVDAATHLVGRGVQVRLVNGGESFATTDQDPSRSLSPFTRTRLVEALSSERLLQVANGCRVEAVRNRGNGYEVLLSTGDCIETRERPINATGFRGNLGPVEAFFEYREDGEILLTEDDESTLSEGCFLAGPLVRHDQHIFCFIYKFRQRFAVIAETLATRMGIAVSEELLEHYERNQMRLVDLSCCGAECLC